MLVALHPVPGAVVSGRSFRCLQSCGQPPVPQWGGGPELLSQPQAGEWGCGAEPQLFSLFLSAWPQCRRGEGLWHRGAEWGGLPQLCQCREGVWQGVDGALEGHQVPLWLFSEV